MGMVQHVEAIYENGVLRPLEPLDLQDSQRVRITVGTPDGRSESDMKWLDEVRAEVAEMTDIPSREEIREMLSVIPGSLTEDFSAEREER
jgi:predicted DNA-binding antitoxin AbrB/MazE fold protein